MQASQGVLQVPRGIGPRWLRQALFALHLIIMAMLAYWIFENVTELQRVTGELAYYDTLNGRFEVTFATWLDTISFGWFGRDRMTRDDVQAL